MRRSPWMVSPATTARVFPVVAVLLGFWFVSSVAPAALGLSQEALDLAGRIFNAYEILLAVLLFTTTVLFVLPLNRSRKGVLRLSILALHGAVLVLWLLPLGGPSFPVLVGLFPPLAAVTVASSSVLTLTFSPHPRSLVRSWWGLAYLALLVLVPVVFAMRVAASLGAGTSPDPGGVYRGNWFLANLPTLFLELLAIGVWLTLVSGFTPMDLRRRWSAFLPFVALPVFAWGIDARKLAGFIVSAVISWGLNLQVFVPVSISLNLAAGSLACYVSSLLLLRGKGRGVPWRLLSIGSASLILAGFRFSMASVEGLSVSFLVLAMSLSAWRERAGRDREALR